MKDDSISDLMNQFFTLNVRISSIEDMLIDKGVFTEKEYLEQINITSKK